MFGREWKKRRCLDLYNDGGANREREEENLGFSKTKGERD